MDTASYQGVVDWNQARDSGIVFGIQKATEGIGYVAPNFAANWSGMKTAGVLRGTYDFGRPDQTDPTAEARNFLTTVGPLDPDDDLWIDLEWLYDANGHDITPVDEGPWATAWTATVESESGHEPGIYSSVAFMESHGLFIPALQKYRLWLASYGGVKPVVPDGWKLVIWQDSDKGSVAGIAGLVDTDVAA